MLPLPTESVGQRYQSCCGKTLCIGCSFGDITENNRTICPFCRTPAANSDEKYIERLKRRVDCNDVIAMNQLGRHYYRGEISLPQDYDRAMKLLLRAGELGSAYAQGNLGYAYENGMGVETDVEKAKYYYVFIICHQVIF